MDVSSLPYYKQLGIRPCREPNHGLFEISTENLKLNHVESIQTASIFALAEACSSLFLTESLGEYGIEGYLPTIRSSEIKFRGTANERVYGVGKPKTKAWEKLEIAYNRGGKGLISFPIYVMSESGKCVAISTFEWHIFRIPQRSRRL